MANRNHIASSSRMPTSKNSTDLQFRICGQPFILDWKLVASRSAKLDKMLKENSSEDIPRLLGDIPANPKTFELFARFCHGYEVSITTENVIHVCCLADYFEMTEPHSSNNLLQKAVIFFENNVITSWNRSVRALKSAENDLKQVLHLGLIDALFESIISKIVADPRLLGKPIKCLAFNDGGEKDENMYRPNARRRLFGSDLQSEDLATLSVQLYETIIHDLIQRQVPSEYVAASLCQYVEIWVSSPLQENVGKSFSKRISQREAIEAVERLLPKERGVLPCALLFKMLRFAIVLEASPDCRNGFEVRIGKQLDQATVKDLLIPSFGYAREGEYNTDCIRRIMKHFYCNIFSPDNAAIFKVAELIEHYLSEVASDVNLKKSTFTLLAEMAFAASVETLRLSDGLYRAISIYLDNHAYLTESEKEDVCRLLDCNKLSREACEHAATNRNLPLRVVVNVLFVHQLHLKDTIVKEVISSDDKLTKPDDEETFDDASGSSENKALADMERMSCKVTELEKECCEMRKEIQVGFERKEKCGVWKEIKRKFMCISTMHDLNCHVKKKKEHPK